MDPVAHPIIPTTSTSVLPKNDVNTNQLPPVIPINHSITLPLAPTAPNIYGILLAINNSELVLIVANDTSLQSLLQSYFGCLEQ